MFVYNENPTLGSFISSLPASHTTLMNELKERGRVVERGQKEMWKAGAGGKELTGGERYIKRKMHSLQAFRIKITWEKGRDRTSIFCRPFSIRVCASFQSSEGVWQRNHVFGINKDTHTHTVPCLTHRMQTLNQLTDEYEGCLKILVNRQMAAVYRQISGWGYAR